MKRTLIAYFSASGVTKKVAEKMAKATGAELFEIEPAVKYTRADLNWMDKKSRSTLEMQDRSCRPPMAKTADVSPYEVVLVGFPVWWYREPSIIDTFIESGDFTGKTVVPFCTSGGSAFAKSADMLIAASTDAKWLPGKRLMAGARGADIESWLKELGLK